MSVLVSQVLTRLNTLLDDASNSKWTQAEKIEAINAAIDDSFPIVKDTQTDSSITLAATTFEYTPSATPEVEWGFSLAYATVPSNPKTLLRRIGQRRSGSAWTILVPADVASFFSGQTMYLQYNTRVARVDDTADTIELPLNYLASGAAYWLCYAALTKSAKFDADPYAKLVQLYARERDTSLRSAARGALPQMIGIVHDAGSIAVDPRTGLLR